MDSLQNIQSDLFLLLSAKSYIQFWTLSFKTDTSKLDRVQEKALEIDRELGNKIPLIRMYKVELLLIRRNNTENTCTQKHEKAEYVCFQ